MSTDDRNAKGINVSIQIFVIYWFLCPTLIGYYVYRFYQRRNHAAIQTRHYLLTILINIFVLCYTAIVIPLSLCITTLDIQWLHHFVTVKIVYPTLYHITWRGAIILIMGRQWGLYYDTRFTVACEDGKWIGQINPIASERNTFIQRKGTFGNDSWMIRHIWGPIFILNLTSAMTIRLLLPLIYNIANQVAFFVGILVFFGVLWLQFPKFRTAFAMWDEMKLLCYVGITSLFIFLGTLVLQTLFPHSFAVNCVRHLIYAIICTVCCLITTYYVLYRSGIDFDRPQFKNAEKVLASIAAATTTPDSNVQLSKVKLLNVLRNRETLNAFMQHCLREFSGENLLCIYELIQFRQFCIAQSISETQTRTEKSLSIRKLSMIGLKKSKRKSQLCALPLTPASLNSNGSDDSDAKQECFNQSQTKSVKTNATNNLRVDSSQLQSLPITPAPNSNGNAADSSPALSTPDNSDDKWATKHLSSVSQLTFAHRRLPSLTVDSVSHLNVKSRSSVSFHSTLIDRIELPSDAMVRSAIVFDCKLSIIEKTSALTEKYIQTGAALEVNISYLCRENLINVVKQPSFQTMGLIERSHIFDPVLTELYGLVISNFIRFKRTPEFKQIFDKQQSQLTTDIELSTV